MKAYILPVVLQILGFCVIVAEIFIPSLGLLTVMALGIYAYSLYLVFTDISFFSGMVFTGVDIILVPILLIAGIKLLAKSPISLKQELSSKDGVVSQSRELEKYIGMQGVAVTTLRPAGAAMFEDQRLDVVTDGEFVEKDSAVVVTGVKGNRIVVESI